MKTVPKYLSTTLFVCAALLFVIPVIADNLGSCTDGLTTTNEANNTCYTFTPERILASDVTVDGTLDGAEPWSSAISKTLSLEAAVDPSLVIGGTVNFLFADDFLILGITVQDNNAATNDSVSIYIDPVHSAASTPQGDEFRFDIERRPLVDQTLRKIPLLGVDVGWPVNGEMGSVGSEVALDVSSGSEWTIEIKIHKADLGLTGGATDLPPIVGVAVHAQSPSSFQAGKWPIDDFVPNTANITANDPATWSNFKTRLPLEYMVVLDQSGSMLSDDKWDSATDAANYLANTMSVFANTTYFRDELGLTTFAWDCFGSDLTAVTDVADDGDGDELAILGAFPIGDYVGDLGVAAPLTNNCTPIGSGINMAFAEVGTTSTEEANRVFLVLSDGLHNRPDDELDLSELDYTPCGTANWDPCASSDIQINTIAFGGAGSVDEELLDNIATYYQGDISAATYNITNNASDLKEVFIQTLDDLYQVNLLAIGGPTSPFVVDPNNAKLAVVAAWNTDPTQAANFDLSFDADDSGTFEPSEVESCDSSGFDTTVGFAICVIDNPQAGSWRANAVVAEQVFPLLDLNLRARFAVDEVVHGTSKDIVLTVDLNEAGLPLFNDPAKHPVSVTVDIRRPGEGLGDILSTHDLSTCEPQDPQLPTIDPLTKRLSVVKDPASAKKLLQSYIYSATNIALLRIDPAADPARPLFQLSEFYFEKCDQDGITETKDPGIALVDDGTNGDVKADDGIYTLRFSKSEYEGSYVFEFNASGTSLAGKAFTRTKTIAAYIRLEVVEEITEFAARDITQNDGFIIREYFVVPRDKFKRYLGPGRGQSVQFYISGAEALGPVVDYNNGIYSQFVWFKPGQEEPKVVPIIQGKPIKSEKKSPIFGRPSSVITLM